MRSSRPLEFFLILAVVAGAAVVLNGGKPPVETSPPTRSPLAQTTPARATPRPPVVDDDLLLYLPLDGNASDLGTLSLATEPVGVEYSRDAVSDENAFATFGEGSFITISSPQAFDGMKEFTLAAWVRPDFLREHLNVISKVTPNRDFNMQINAVGNMTTHIASDSSDYEFCFTERTLQPKTWTHVASTFKNNTWTIYLDGEVAASTMVQRAPGWTGQFLTVGNLYPHSGESFMGGLDDVRIYKRALSGAEIANLPKR